MASPLRQITSSFLLLRRSVVRSRPAVGTGLSADRLLENTMIQTRALITTPLRIAIESAIRRDMRHLLVPKGVSVVSSVVEGRHLVVTKVPGIEKKEETDEALVVSFNMPPGSKMEDVKTRIEDGRVVIIEGKNQHKDIYMAAIELPNLNNNCDLIGELQDGMLKLTLPKLKNNALAKIMAYLRGGAQNISKTFPFAHYDRSNDLHTYIGSLLAATMLKYPDSNCSSLTVYRKETAESLVVKAWVPGMEKEEFVSEGLCISLDMPGLEIQDVKSYFKKHTFFIEGKKGNEGYMQAMIIPHDDKLLMKNDDDRIKKEMQDGVYTAIIPHMTRADRMLYQYQSPIVPFSLMLIIMGSLVYFTHGAMSYFNLLS